MDVNEFEKKVMDAKIGKQTIGVELKVSTNSQRTAKHIFSGDVCGSCKRPSTDGLVVWFKEPQKELTIFQAELLYSLYCLNKRPVDYAGYHGCVAGKEFIENIKYVVVD